MINYGSSIQGRRENNQDSFIIYAPNSQTTFIAVADGIGGNVGGKIASNLVIDTAGKIIAESISAGLKQSELKPIMFKIYSEAQKAIDVKISGEIKLNKMGTTLSCVLVHNDCYVWGSIGDSRIYHFTNGEFHQITQDHSFVEKLALFEEEKSANGIMENYGHIVTRSLCSENDEPDIFPKDVPCEKLNNGEGFLICSDGLLVGKNGNQNQILNKFITESNTLNEAIDGLISYAYEMGSNDNITCVSIWKEWEERVNNIMTNNS